MFPCLNLNCFPTTRDPKECTWVDRVQSSTQTSAQLHYFPAQNLAWFLKSTILINFHFNVKPKFDAK